VRCAAGSRVQTRLAGEKQGAHREEEEIGGDNWEQKGHRLLPRGAEHHPTCPTTLSGTYLFYTSPYFHRRTGPTLPRPTYCTLQQHALGSPRAACARATDRDTFPAPVQKTLVPHTGKWPNFSTVHGHLSPGAAASAPCPYEACTERKDRGRDVRRRDTYRCGQCVHCASGPAETGGSCAADTRRPAGVAVSEDRRLPCPRGLRPDCDWMDGEDRAGRKEGTAGSGSSQARRVGRGVAVPTSL
jgi:hypothetical protein